MWSLKNIHKYLAGIVLLVSLASFNVISGLSALPVHAQTELVIDATSSDEFSVVYSNSFLLGPINHGIDRYTVFNFKFLLLNQAFDLKVTFKTQKERVLHLNDLNILQQNLIAKVHSTLPKEVL